MCIYNYVKMKVKCCPGTLDSCLRIKSKMQQSKLLIQYIVNRWQVKDRTIQQHTDSRRETNTEVVCIQGT